MAEAVALHQIAAELDQGAELGVRFHALGDHLQAHVAADGDHGSHEATLDGAGVDVADEGHVELHEVGIEAHEARQARVALAQVVDGDAEAEGAQGDEVLVQARHAIE